MKDAQVSLKIMNSGIFQKIDYRYDNPSGKTSHKEKHTEKEFW